MVSSSDVKVGHLLCVALNKRPAFGHVLAHQRFEHTVRFLGFFHLTLSMVRVSRVHGRLP